MLRLLAIFLSISLFIGSCRNSKQREPNTLPRETFVDLYTDLLIVGETESFSPSDTSKVVHRKASVDSLFVKYGVTESQVRETIAQYSKNLRLWKEFYDDVLKRLEELQRVEQKKKQS